MQNAAPLHYYRLYGLTIATTRSLPGLDSIALPDLNDATVDATVDVTVNLLGTPHPESKLLHPEFWKASEQAHQDEGFFLWTTQDGDDTYWRLRSHDDEGTLDFVINADATQVWGFWSGDEWFRDAVSLLLGAVMGHVLRLRNVLCLHASVVAVQNKAIALIGNSGAGKSTTAAALARQGFSVLTDDIAALYRVDQHLWVQPGYPSLRLWSPSLQALQLPIAELPQISNRWDKRFVELQTQPNPSGGSIATQPQTHRFTAHPLPLSAVYVLSQRDPNLTQVSIEPLALTQALQHLLIHSYGRGILTRSQKQAEVEQFAAIAKTLPVRHVCRPDDLQQLDDLCAAIANDLGESRLPHFDSNKPQYSEAKS